MITLGRPVKPNSILYNKLKTNNFLHGFEKTKLATLSMSMKFLYVFIINKTQEKN